MPSSVYEERDGKLFAGDLARGPWDPGAQHGGAPAAMMVRAFEHAAGETELALARVTIDLLRPVPLGELAIETAVVRPGRRVQAVDGWMRTPNGIDVIHARALWVARSDIDSGERVSPPPGPEAARQEPFWGSSDASFVTDAMDVRFIEGSYMEIGPAIAWFRLRVPLLDAERPSPLQRLAAAADFPNGISATLASEDYLFINPELTIYVEREPIGEWICLDARTTTVSNGVGLAEAVLYDESGRVGRALQSLLIARR